MVGNNEQKHYAYLRHPAVEALLYGHTQFVSFNLAAEYLEVIRNSFKVSRFQPKEAKAHSLILWVKGYALTEEEIQQGYTGNYALLHPEPRDDSGFMIRATKLPAELKYHPEKKRPKRKHPDWGHGILRQIKKGTVYPTIEEVQAMLGRLHQEFPEISYAGLNFVLIMIYSRAENAKKPVQRYKLEIKPHKDGGFVVDYRLHVPDKNRKSKTPLPGGPAGATPAEPSPEAQVGKFTSLVEAKRKKKKIGN